VIRGATLSGDRVYRYALTRQWGDGERVAFIGLNPSTADATTDDPTIRRCIGFARDWGYDGLVMLNLFAFRATDPAVMMAAADPVGPENDATIMEYVDSTAVIVAAWGAHGDYRKRGASVRAMIPDLRCLKLTKNGHPGHPLYLPKTLLPQPWP